jgi:glycine dehydrogenase subunit 1
VATGYLALTETDREEMLRAIGASSIGELFADIPEEVRLGRELDLPPAASEVEVERELTALAGRNVHNGCELSFLGAGSYDHYVPAIVEAVVSRPELLTAYTPYQPEMSQGILQAIFEYQTVVCELTGMEVSNASSYDGAAAAADTCYMASRATGRKKIAIAETVNPQVRQVVSTYAPGFGLEVVEAPHEDGLTDPERFRSAAEGAAAAIFQQPNFFGCLEQAPDLAAAAGATGALAVAHVDPLSLGVLEAPGNYGCDIAIGEGQACGNRLSFGGPHFGFLAAKKHLIRQMPGRIAGQTTDRSHRRGFVLTFQTREQHIRREKATSNITTNQSLCALAGLVYLSWLGPNGLRKVGETCMSLAALAREKLALPAAFAAPAFKELALKTAHPAEEVVREAKKWGVNPGYPLGRDYPEMDDVLLVAVTERRSPADIERLAETLREVLG